MIHPGPVLVPLYAKMEPIHWPFEICPELKSVGEMDHDWPPKENATLTFDEHATETIFGQYTSNTAREIS